MIGASRPEQFKEPRELPKHQGPVGKGSSRQLLLSYHLRSFGPVEGTFEIKNAFVGFAPFSFKAFLDWFIEGLSLKGSAKGSWKGCSREGSVGFRFYGLGHLLVSDFRNNHFTHLLKETPSHNTTFRHPAKPSKIFAISLKL